MEIVLFISSADKERVDKTAYLSQLMQLEGFLRDPASVENPTITLQLSGALGSQIVDADGEEIADADGFAIGTSPRITEANYMYIPEFGRYYFISDITLNHTGLYIISARVDPLMSFKEYIKQLDCFVSRNEYEFFPMLQDDLLPLDFRKEILENELVDGSLVNTQFKIDGFPAKATYVLTLVNDYPAGGHSITPPAYTDLPSIDANAFSSYGSALPYAIAQSTLREFSGKAMQDDTLLSFVKSLVAFPFKIEGLPNDLHKGHYNFRRPNDSKIQIKPDDPNQPRYYLRGDILNYMSDYLVVADFNMASADSFLDFAPYTRYELFLPFYGYVEIDAQKVANHRLIVYYSVNYEDGSGNVYIYDCTAKRQVFSSACQLGIKIGISASNLREVTNQRNAENTNLALNLLASFGTIGSGIASENPLLIGAGLLNAGRSITSYINSNANIFDRGIASFSSSSNALYSNMKVRIRRTRIIRGLTDSQMLKFAHSVGRPLRQYRTLGELSGFTIAQSVHLDGIPCLSGEAETILNALSSGVIL